MATKNIAQSKQSPNGRKFAPNLVTLIATEPFFSCSHTPG
jgi:hypothetical protein